MIVYASLPQMVAFLLCGWLIPVAAAEPGGTPRLRDEPLELVSEVGVEVRVALKAAVIAVDVVDMELGVLSPLDVGLEESVVVFHAALAQCKTFPDQGGKASARASPRRARFGPDSFPAGHRCNSLPRR